MGTGRGTRVVARRTVVLGAALAAGAALLVPTSSAGAVAGVASAATVPAAAQRAAKAGAWHTLATGADIQAGTPAVWTDAGNRAWVLWQRKPAPNESTYEYAAIASNGKLSVAPSDAFAGHHWAGLSGSPTLLGQGGKPLVVFNGGNGVNGSDYNLGCVYGALGGTSPWTLQPWSLSNNCVNPVGSAAQSATGVLAAAWPGGWNNGNGALYRVGVSPSFPAAGTDGHLAISTGTVYKTAVANDAVGNGHFYVAYARSAFDSSDGIYAVDVTAHGAAIKAPSSGTNTIGKIGQFANLAMTATNTHGGVYLAYCSNAPTCSVRLWRVGSKQAVAVPGSSGAYDIALSAGPTGRLWVAWYNESTNRVSVVRSNRSDTGFGKVATFATPCFEHGNLGLSSGIMGRVDIALQCVNKNLQLGMYYRQSKVGLHVHLSKKHASSGSKVTVKVTDAGDAVAGAKVKLGKVSTRTNSKGRAKLKVPAKLSPGTYRVKAKKSGYSRGSARLTVS